MPRALAGRILRHTWPEHITSGGLQPQHSPTTERQRTKGKWVEKEGKVRSALASVLAPGPCAAQDCCEKEHSSPSRKIHGVNKPTDRQAGRTGRMMNRCTSRHPVHIHLHAGSPGTPAWLPYVTLCLFHDFNSGRQGAVTANLLRVIYTFKEINLPHSPYIMIKYLLM